MKRSSREAISAPDWTRRSDLTVLGVVNRVYSRKVVDGELVVIVGKEPPGWHLSISHQVNDRPGRYPTWDEIADARYQFTPNEVTMVMLLPPREEYVNFHPTVFHLWQQ